VVNAIATNMGASTAGGAMSVTSSTGTLTVVATDAGGGALFAEDTTTGGITLVASVGDKIIINNHVKTDGRDITLNAGEGPIFVSTTPFSRTGLSEDRRGGSTPFSGPDTVAERDSPTGGISTGSATGGDIIFTGTLRDSGGPTFPALVIDAGIGTFSAEVNIASTDIAKLAIGGLGVTLTGTVGGETNNIRGAVLIGLLPGASGTFGGVTLSGFIDLAAITNDISTIDLSRLLDIETGSLDTTPAAAAFCSDIRECPVVVDVFGTDYSLVEAGGGSEGAYQESPFVTENFWEQLLSEERKSDDL